MKTIIDTKFFTLYFLTKWFYILPEIEVCNIDKIALHFCFRFIFIRIDFIINKETNIENFKTGSFVFLNYKNFFRLIFFRWILFDFDRRIRR